MIVFRGALQPAALRALPRLGAAAATDDVIKRLKAMRSKLPQLLADLADDACLELRTLRNEKAQ